MRRAIAVAATLALAGCKLDFEGAGCDTPGTTSQCPSGQACGNDKTCSARAAACADFCTPGASESTSPKRCKPGSAAVETCTSVDPICGAWTVSTPCATDLVCAGSGGLPACVCAAPSAEIHVDQAALSDATLTPTGAASPDACRFKKLGDALTYARNVWLPANAAPATVSIRAHGTPASGSPVTFDAESFPLSIPSRATLTTTAATPTPGDWVITAPAGTGDLVDIEGGATLEGFTVKTIAATGDGIVVVCPNGVSSPANLSRTVVDGGGTINRGVVVTGACGLVANQLDVANAAKSGLFVSTSSVSIGADVTGGSLKGNGESGAEVVAGRLSIAGTSTGARFDISLNSRHGVRAVPDSVTPQPIALSLAFADVHHNSEVGVRLESLPPTSSVSVTSSLLRKNSATSAYSMYGPGRLAGGVLAWGTLPTITQGGSTAPAFAFKGNTVCSNQGDGIAVYSNDPWPFAGDACDATGNVFVTPAASTYYIYSTTTVAGADAVATHNYWAPDPPTGLVVKATYVPSCGAATVPAECN